MASIQEIQDEVDRLGADKGKFRFLDALKHIEEASQNPAVDSSVLRDILGEFREKIPDLVVFNRIRADAKDLADAMTLADLDERIGRIRARNEALSDLTSKLQTQIDKANQDANLLKNIKEGIEKATKTVNEAKAIVDQLTATDADTKAKLKALIEGLGRISAILNPPAA